jgi:hypothetical protein
MPEKIAFLFLTRGEVHNIKLWESFFENADTSKYKLLIHAKNPAALSSPIWNSKNSTILKPIPTAWGTISLVKATIYLLQTAMTDTLVTKFILLSEFCIPTTNFNNIYDSLIKEVHRSRINWTVGKNMDRYNIIKSYLNIPPHNWAKQSQWMCLDRKHVSNFINPMYTNIINQQLKDYMYCPAPDEHFFINVFLYVVRINSNEIINHPVTYVDWSNNSKHPVTFNTIIREVIETCRKNKIFFARKFVQMNLSEDDINYLLDLKQPIEESSKEEQEPKEEEQEPKEEEQEPIEGEEPKEKEEPIEEPPITNNVVTDKQKQAVLDFFTNIVNNLSAEKVQTIYSALFSEQVVEEPLNIVEIPLEVVEEPLQIVEEPLEVVEESIEVVEEPLNIVEIPLQVVEEPLEVIEESIEVIEESIETVEIPLA